MKAASVDFETYYDDECSVVPLGTVAYTRHPNFDAYMVSIYSEDYKFVGSPFEAEWHKIKDHVWLSHNAGFDQAVFDWVRATPQAYNRKDEHGIPYTDYPIPLQWHCTSNLCAYIGAPRGLDRAAKFLLGKEVSKDMRKWMKGKTWQQAIDAGKAQAMLDYAMHDAVLCYELWEKYNKYWPEHERWLSDHTYRQGERGIYVDIDMLDVGVHNVKKAIWEAEQNMPWMKEVDAKGKNYAPTSPRGLADSCQKVGINPPVSTAEDSEECDAWENQYADTYPWVASIRTHRKANKILRLLEKLKKRTLCNNTITYSLKYFGAHTGRWSGDGGFNIQNMHKGDILGVDIRKILRARPGKKFVICDLSQIEPRVLAWKVGDWDLLDQVRKGFSIYEAYARARGKWDGGRLKDEDGKLYKWAKACVLGLGYGCGAEKFVKVAATMAKLTVSLEEAKECVREYRQANPKVTQFWYALDSAFQSTALNDHDPVTGAMIDTEHTFELPLPSGRSLVYRNVTRNNGFQCQTILGEPLRGFWGGALCENFVQATSRDVFANGLMNLERAGLGALFHVHDEYVCEVEKNLDPSEIVGIVTKVPSWLQGCPIEAEAIESDHYTK